MPRSTFDARPFYAFKACQVVYQKLDSQNK